MRPAQRGKVENHSLHVLDLGEGDRNSLRRRDRLRRIDQECRPGLSAWTGGGDLDVQRCLPGRENRDIDLGLYGFDPECGVHRTGNRVGSRLNTYTCGGALQESNISDSTAQHRAWWDRGDLEDERLGDVLALDSVQQYKVRIVQNFLGDCTSRNEVGKVLRQSWCVGGGRLLAGEQLRFACCSKERSYVHCWNDTEVVKWRWAWIGFGGVRRNALGVDGRAVWDGGHPNQCCLEIRICRAHPISDHVSHEVLDSRLKKSLESFCTEKVGSKQTF
jgi:hypothetical protein